MNFLELCQRVRAETGVTSTGPTSVDAQVGMLEKVVNWTKQAVNAIQLESVGWRFLWSSASAVTVADKKIYTSTDLGIPDLKNLEVVLIGTSRLNVRSWAWWLQNIRQTGLADQKGQPTNIVIAPDNRIHFYPVPDKEYTLEIDYFRTPVGLVEGTDVPVIPSQYHDAIVVKAVEYYSVHEDDTVRFQQAQQEYEEWLNLMSRDLTPEIKFL